MSAEAICRSCKAPIIWAETTEGKRMPVDAEPSEPGNIKLVDRGPRRLPIAVILDATALRSTTEVLRLSHFATCPEGRNWRRR
jgi:hypothetical protein